MKIIKLIIVVNFFFLSSFLEAKGTLKGIYESTDSEEAKLLNAQKYIKRKMQTTHQLDGRFNELGQQRWDLYLFAKFVKWGVVAVEEGHRFMASTPDFKRDLEESYLAGDLNIEQIREKYNLRRYSGFVFTTVYKLRCADPKWDKGLDNSLNLLSLLLNLAILKDDLPLNLISQPKNIPHFIKESLEDIIKNPHKTRGESEKSQLVKAWGDWRQTSFKTGNTHASNSFWYSEMP